MRKCGNDQDNPSIMIANRRSFSHFNIFLPTTTVLPVSTRAVGISVYPVHRHNSAPHLSIRWYHAEPVVARQFVRQRVEPCRNHSEETSVRSSIMQTRSVKYSGKKRRRAGSFLFIVCPVQSRPIGAFKIRVFKRNRYLSHRLLYSSSAASATNDSLSLILAIMSKTVMFGPRL